MARLSEIKEQKIVVESVGGFAGSLQQIAAARMAKLRRMVLASRRFVDEATVILRELQLEQKKLYDQQIHSVVDKNPKSVGRKAIIIVSSNQGLCGSYNTEIQKKVEMIYPKHTDADFFVIGSKIQEYFSKIAARNNLSYYPFNIPEEVKIDDLKPIIGMFHYYDQIFLIYSKFINTTTRDVVFLELAVPNIEEIVVRQEEEEGKFIFEPELLTLIRDVSNKLRYALFRQQILDSKLSLYTAQMIAMQTASDNAIDLLKELQMEYNKARRKQIDKKIQEVQAGRALWDAE